MDFSTSTNATVIYMCIGNIHVARCVVYVQSQCDRAHENRFPIIGVHPTPPPFKLTDLSYIYMLVIYVYVHVFIILSLRRRERVTIICSVIISVWCDVLGGWGSWHCFGYGFNV